MDFLNRIHLCKQTETDAYIDSWKDKPEEGVGVNRSHDQ